MSKLREAYELIKDPNRWCKDYTALDADGNPCMTVDGVRFCALGAIFKVSGGYGHYEPFYDILSNKSYELFNLPLTEVNDIKGHEAVMKIYEAALGQE